MSIADELKAASLGEVECDGLRFQVRKIVSRELLAVGARHMVATLAKREGDDYAPETEQEHILAQQLAVLSEADLWCVASVVATRRTEADPWEPLRIVGAEADEDLSASPPRLWVEALPMKARGAILHAATALTMGREGSATIDSFRRGSEPAVAGGGTGEAVREVAP